MAPHKRKRKNDDAAEGAPKLQRRNAITDSTVQPARLRTTRSMTTDGPRQAVFATAELLEQIMLYLPSKTIFLSQRVCRQFQDLVKTSVALQQKVFIRPLLPDDKVWERGPPSSSQSGIGGSMFDLTPFTLVTRSPGDLKAEQVRPVVLNPHLGILRNYLPYAQQRLRYDLFEDLHFLGTKPLQFRHLQHQGLSSSAQLTDPPCMKVEIRAYWAMRASQRRSANGRLTAVINKKSGVTFADIWSALLEAKSDHYSTGSQHHTIGECSFADLHDRFVREGYKPVQFKRGDIFLTVHGIAVPSDSEWRTVRSRDEIQESSGDAAGR